MNRKKALPIIIPVVVAVTAAALLLFFLVRPALKRGREPESPLSFKPFTLHELLNLDLEIDPGTSGKVIRSPELEKIKKQTAEVRGLDFKKPVTFRSRSEANVRAQIEESFREEVSEEELEADRKLLVALGLIPEKENLKKTLTDVYTEQVAGSYDTETKDISIIEGKGLGGVMGEVTIAHETTHALQDQNFRLDEPPLENDAYNGDNELAVESLIEGDAMDTMLEYAKKYVDIAELMKETLKGLGGEMSSEKLEGAPRYVRESLLFPYEQGLTFTQALKRARGEAGVNAAFKDPPLSSEQIIHPGKYFKVRDNPRPVPLTDMSGILGKGWRLINSDTMGEFDMSVWFEQYSGLLAARDASNGWGGNTIQYYQGPGDRYVVVNASVWDTPEDAKQFFDRYAGLLEKRFGRKLKAVEAGPNRMIWEADGGQFLCSLSGDGTLCLQAPDRATIELVRGRFPGYP